MGKSLPYIQKAVRSYLDELKLKIGGGEDLNLRPLLGPEPDSGTYETLLKCVFCFVTDWILNLLQSLLVMLCCDLLKLGGGRLLTSTKISTVLNLPALFRWDYFRLHDQSRSVALKSTQRRFIHTDSHSRLDPAAVTVRSRGSVVVISTVPIRPFGGPGIFGNYYSP